MKILFASLCVIALMADDSKAQTDSLYYDIDSITFTAGIKTTAIKKTGPMTTGVDLDRIQSLPKIMGNTDPVNFIRNLPGVQTGTEYDSGIHIQGCDNAHNHISMAGVPIYGANHLFGFFSIFNPTHFNRMTFSRTASGNRLGGSLEMGLPDTLKKKATGEIALGLMSAQGTLGARITDRSHLKISARQSYMNLLYGRWLQIDGSPVRYGFGDYNISWLYEASDTDRIWAEAYFGQDKANLESVRFNVGLTSGWGNYAGALHWKRKTDKVDQHHTLWTSGYFSDGRIQQMGIALNLDSFINSYGYKGTVGWNDFLFGADATIYDVQPQYPESDGFYSDMSGSKERQTALETSASARYSKILSDNWSIECGLRGNLYLSPENQYDLSLSPDISITCNTFRFGRIAASYGWRHQYLFQVGLSNTGLPVEFWFMAGKYSLPQKAQLADISYDVDLFHGDLNISFSTYFKRLYNQVEYKGDLFDFLNSRYDLNRHLLRGDGWNYGLNMMVHKQTGNLTGWISYSLGRALRRFDNPSYTGIYPADHERIHELNAVCAYKLKRWNFSGTFIYASGIPFTAPEYYYISSGQIMSKPGEHNGCRMRPYIRLDLSVTCTIMKNEKGENGINFSLYNATGRYNDVMYRLDADNGSYSYKNVGFFLKWVPSISYHHKF